MFASRIPCSSSFSFCLILNLINFFGVLGGDGEGGGCCGEQNGPPLISRLMRESRKWWRSWSEVTSVAMPRGAHLVLDVAYTCDIQHISRVYKFYWHTY